MSTTDLHELVEVVFRSRGYSFVTSSRENRYLLLRKGDVTMAVGYGASDSPPTEGEVEMFVSMAGNDSASRMVFLAPVVPGREARAVLQREKVSIWDRVSLTLAIGEAALVEAGGRPEREIVGTPRGRTVPPGSAGLSSPDRPSRQGSAMVEPLDIRSMLKGGGPASEARTVPTPEPLPERPGPGLDGLDESLSVAMDHLGDIPSLFVDPGSSVREGDPPSYLPEGHRPHPWKGSRLAPVKLNGEEACTRAGAQVDPQPELVLVPHMLLDVRYDLRSGQLEPLERTGCFLLNMMDRHLDDIPSAISSELCSLKDIWEGAGSPRPLDTAVADLDTDGKAILLERLKGESITQDRLIRDSLMSTIYQEATYRFDPSSFEVLRTERLMIPFWVRRSADGSIEWSVDSFLGRFLPGAKGQ